MHRVTRHAFGTRVDRSIFVCISLVAMSWCVNSYAEDLPPLTELELIHSRPFHKMLDNRGRQYELVSGNGEYAWAIFVPPGARRTVIELATNREIKTFADILNADYPPAVRAMSFEGKRLLVQAPQGRSGIFLNIDDESTSASFRLVPKSFKRYLGQIRWDGNWLRYVAHTRKSDTALFQYSTAPGGGVTLFRHEADILGYGGLADGTRVATVDQTGDIHYWATADPKTPLRVFHRAAHGMKRSSGSQIGSSGRDGITCVMQSDRPLLAFIDRSKRIHAFDLEVGQDVWRGVNGELGPVTLVQFENSGHHVMVRKDSEWWIVRIPDGRVVQRFNRPEGEISLISGDLSTMIFTQHRVERIYHLDRTQTDTEESTSTP